MSAFFLIICRSLEIKHSLKTSLNDSSWREIIADFSKTVEKKKKMRHRFEDSVNVNMLN